MNQSKSVNNQQNIDLSCIESYLKNFTSVKYCDLNKVQKKIFNMLKDEAFKKDLLRAIIAILFYENSELEQRLDRLNDEKFANNNESTVKAGKSNGKAKTQRERKMREDGSKDNEPKKPGLNKGDKLSTTDLLEAVKAGKIENGSIFRGILVKVEDVMPGDCKECGNPLKVLESYDARAKLCFQRPILYYKVEKFYRGKCENEECEMKGESQKRLVEDDAKKRTLSIGLTAELAKEKYQKCVAIFTQRCMKADITYETMLNSVMWLGKKLEPLADRIEDSMFEKSNTPVVYIDETYFTITKPDKKENGEIRKKNYIFVMVNEKAVYYKATMSRSAEWFREKLEALEFILYVSSDDFSGYNAIAPEVHQLCLCHVRRIIFYAVLSIPDEIDKEETEAYKLLLSINAIFKKEREIKNLSFPVRKKIRNSVEYSNLLKDFKSKLNDCKKSTIEGTMLHEAVEYTLDNWEEMWTFRKEGYLECHNTKAELAVKALAKLRKTSMCFNNSKSAKINCDLLSIVQTADKYNIDINDYLVYAAHYIDTAPIDDLLPWSDNLFKLPMPDYE